MMLERPGLREETGQVLGGEKDLFPISGTLCAKWGLVRISRKDNKSIIYHLEWRTKGPGHRLFLAKWGRGYAESWESCIRTSEN
jgi:hypothetical protein